MEQLRLQLIDDCNKSGLSLEAILFVVRDVYRDALETYNKVIKVENKQLEQEEEA